MNKKIKMTEADEREKDLLRYKLLLDKLQNEIVVMKERANENFLNSPIYIKMAKQIEDLEVKNKQLEESIRKGVPEEKNIRRAGRKEILSIQDKELIKMYRIQGYKLKEISEMFSCSIGLVSKILSEDKNAKDEK